MSDHECPCGCGVPIPRARLSCPASWFRLPTEMRTAIQANYQRDFLMHARAVSAAIQWLKDNP